MLHCDHSAAIWKNASFFVTLPNKFVISLTHVNAGFINMIDDTDDITLSTEEPEGKPKSHGPFMLLLDILFTGTAGWKRLRRARLTPEQSAAGCFYPILALVSVCRFADWFYLPEFDLAATLVSSASIFASFFFSYFAAQVLCKWFFPSEAKTKVDTAYFKHVVQYSLASLALFGISSELLPVLEPITVFLPIWTVFIITKGVRFLRLPENNKNRCMITIIVSTVLTPYVFIWLCEKIF